jgi:lipoyl(octanoyl) transferase
MAQRSATAETDVILGKSGERAGWRLWIDEGPRPGWANMAIDQTLLQRAEQFEESWLRLYQWQPHCLSFGRNEPARSRYNLETIRVLEMDTVRRPTGGRAVWHGGELTYAVAAPISRFHSLRTAYLSIHQMLADALTEMGAKVLLAPKLTTPSLGAGACFSHAVGGEIMSSQGKIVGSAQYRHGDALLQHGSILLEDDQSRVHAVTIDPDTSPSPGISLGAILGRCVTAPEVAAIIGKTAPACWKGSWTSASDTAVIVQAASLHFSHFRSEAWTWSR